VLRVMVMVSWYILMMYVTVELFLDCSRKLHTSPTCVCTVRMLAVGQYISQHGKPRHLHAATFSVPRATEKDPSTPELPTCCQQHGGQVRSITYLDA